MSILFGVKGLARLVVRPIWRPIWRRIDARALPIEDRVAAVGQRVSALSDKAVRQDDAIGQLRHDQAQAGGELLRIGSEVARLWERLELVRRETLFEMKYGPKPALVTAVEPKILATKKVESARTSGIKLNLGCGHIALDRYVNVDRRELPGVDVLAEAGNLPFERGSVQEIFSSHMLEHFPEEDLRRRLLPYWRGLLRTGGIFRAIVPDGAAMLSSLAEGSYGFEEFREVLFGAQDYEGDFHFNLLTPDSLSRLLKEAGFTDIQVPVQGRRNGKCFEFEISAAAAEQ